MFMFLVGLLFVVVANFAILYIIGYVIFSFFGGGKRK